MTKSVSGQFYDSFYLTRGVPMDDNKMNDEAEQGFNDAELQDIMNEIESLEKEFVGPADESPAPVEAEKTDLQKAIDEEMESLEMESSLGEMEVALNEADDMSEEFSDEDFEEEAPMASNVHPLAKGPAQSSGSPMEIKAHGQMEVNLAFQVADQTAHLCVDPQGLKVELNGVVVWIDAEKGCSIELPGGGKFSFPVQACTSAKKAA